MPHSADEHDPATVPDPSEESRFRTLASNTSELAGLTWDDWLKKDLRSVFSNSEYRANLIVAGRAGVGKSALLNTIFGETVAKEGTGLPVTDRIQKYASNDLPVTIWDTKGLTVAVDIEKALAELQSVIRDTRLQEQSEHIHLALYCVNARGTRVLPEEFELIRKLAVDVPVLVVLTQCFGSDDKQAGQLASVIHEQALPLASPVIFKVLAKKMDIDATTSVQPFGVPELVRAVAELLPSAASSAFVTSQRLVVDVKVRSAKKIVAAAAAGAGAIGMTPIPLVDAPGIAAVQFAMINRISAVMGLQHKSVNAALQASGVLGMLTSLVVGRAAARILRSLIPVAGNMINGGTAARATFTLGNQYIKLCVALLEKFPTGDIPVERLQAAMRSLLNNSSEGEEPTVADSSEPVVTVEPSRELDERPAYEIIASPAEVGPEGNTTTGSRSTALLAEMERRIAAREQPRP